VASTSRVEEFVLLDDLHDVTEVMDSELLSLRP
jgi:hypothetical protein